MFRHIDIQQYTSDLLSCTYNGGSYILVCIHTSGVPVLLGCRRNCCQLGVHLQPPWYIRSFDVLDERIFSWGNIFHGAWASSTSERLLARWYNCMMNLSITETVSSCYSIGDSGIARVSTIGLVVIGLSWESQGLRFDPHKCPQVWHIWSSICPRCDEYDLK